VSTVRVNVLANLAGQGWSAALQLLLVPLYLHVLGVEAYALISLYVVLITTLQVFDLGLSQTLNRELALARGRDAAAVDARDMARTIEIAYWVIVLGVCGVLLAAAPFLVAYKLVVAMMIVLAALQWSSGLYQSGLMGLQEPVLANALRIGIATTATAGSALVLWLVSPTLAALFAWQIAAASLGVALFFRAFHGLLPPAPAPARFRPELLRAVWRFAAGASALTITAVLLTQADKWILVQRLSLETYGYYALAWTAASALGLLSAPVFAAIYPRFSTLFARGERDAEVALYHLATQALAAGLAPLALVLALHAEAVLALWTGDAAIASRAAPLLSVLVMGSLLNALAHAPYAWQLAQGRTRALVVFNLVAIAIALPAVWWLADTIGAMGAALVWFALNAGYLLVLIPLVHRRLPLAERLRWLARDVAAPLGAAAALLWLARWLVPAPSNPFALLALLAAATLAAALAAPATRALLLGAARSLGTARR
jgi:O-antigen/teichoic acid export membrane protein